MVIYTVKLLLFVGTNFRGFYKINWSLGFKHYRKQSMGNCISLDFYFRGFFNMHWSTGSWIRGFKHYRKQSMGKLYFVGFLFSWFL